MAEDQKPQENAKAAPPQVRSGAELMALYDRLQELEWNAVPATADKPAKPGTAYKNPTTVMRTLVSFGRICARLLADGIARLTAAEGKIAALDGRQSALETRLAAAEGKIAALEAARAADEVQQGAAIEAAIAQIADLPPEEAAAARAQLAELMNGPDVPAAIKAKIQSALTPPPAPPKAEAPVQAQDAAVVPIKPPKKPAKDPGSSQGGAASGPSGSGGAA